MLDRFAEQMRGCKDVLAAVDCVLAQALDICDARFGNVQLMDRNAGCLEIKAQRGFHDEFLSFFARVTVEDGSACARALRKRDPIIVEDVLLDEQFVPCRAIVARAGIRAVQSTPLISTSGALVGVVSTHFPASHRPTELQMLAIAEAARGAANAIIHVRANDCADLSARRHNSLELLVQSRAAIARADELLSRRTRIGASHSG